MSSEEAGASFTEDVRIRGGHALGTRRSIEIPEGESHLEVSNVAERSRELGLRSFRFGKRKIRGYSCLGRVREGSVCGEKK